MAAHHHPPELNHVKLCVLIAIITAALSLTACHDTQYNATKQKPERAKVTEQEDLPQENGTPYSVPIVDISTAPLIDAAVQTFRTMDGFGPNAEDIYQKAKHQFLEREGAFTTLAGIYNESVKGEQFTQSMGWKSVFLIGEIDTDESIEFLADIVLSKRTPIGIDHEQHENEDPQGKDSEIVTHYNDNLETPIRYTAINALVDKSLAENGKATNVLRTLIVLAEPDLKRYISLALYSNGILDKFRQDFNSIGLDFNYATLPPGKDVLEVDIDSLNQNKPDFRNLPDPVSYTSFDDSIDNETDIQNSSPTPIEHQTGVTK